MNGVKEYDHILNHVGVEVDEPKYPVKASKVPFSALAYHGFLPGLCVRACVCVCCNAEA